jgi:Fic family protein
LDQWRSGKRSALERAAYALWRLNWIHPFAGGNGRTSRAVAYLILCAEDGAMMPGKPTMPSLIHQNRREYITALRACDAAELSGEPDFTVMVDHLREMLMRQLASAIDRLSKPSS